MNSIKSKNPIIYNYDKIPCNSIILYVLYKTKICIPKFQNLHLHLEFFNFLYDLKVEFLHSKNSCLYELLNMHMTLLSPQLINILDTNTRIHLI